MHWKAIEDTYAALMRHGDGNKKLWLNEYGWNTTDEEKKSAHLRAVLTELAKPKYHMVFQANYLVLTDLPETDDRTGHDFGLCSRDRHTGTIQPRLSYEAFRDLPKTWPEAKVKGKSEKKPKRGKAPKGFMLAFKAPGCEPGEECDDS